MGPVERARAAADKAVQIFHAAEQKAEEAYAEFEKLRNAAQEAKKNAEELERSIAPDQQGTQPALREAIKQLRAASNDKTAKAAARNAAKEIEFADNIAKRIEGILTAVPSHYSAKSGTGKPSNPRVKSAQEARTGEVLKAVASVKTKVQNAQTLVTGAVKALRAVAGPQGASDAANLAEKSADSFKQVVNAARKAAESIEKSDKVMWPKSQIWIKDFEKITKLAESVRVIASETDPKLEATIAPHKEKIEEYERKAREAYDEAMTTEVLLKVVGFFEDHREQIFNRLEECDNVANQAVSNRDMLFIAESLPIINGIIHVGSSRKELKAATDWVKRKWGGGEAHPRIVLSALLFKYVTKIGADTFIRNEEFPEKEIIIPEKEIIWKRIKERVKRLL